MIRWIIALSAQYRLLVVALAGVIMFFGVTQLRKMPVDLLPEFSRPYVEVQTEALGLSAAEVESMITTPLEADMLNGVPWVDEIRSESIPGLSSIVLVFKPGTDILAARQMVQERLVSVYALPGVSKPPAMLNPLSSASRCMKIGLKSEELSLIEMSVLARWTIKPRLMGVPGVANVSIWGLRERQLQVQVDPEQLRDRGVTLDQIVSTTGNALWVSPLSFLNASTPGTGGFIDTPNQRLGVRHVLPISTPEQLAEVIVEGTDMRLGDVANVVEDHQPLIGDALVDDSPALMLVIEKFPWANTREVTRRVEEALTALQPGLSGITMDPTLFRPATFVETAIGNLAISLLIGGALAALALLAFFYNWRTALIGIASIATSVLAAAVVLYACGVEVNMMIFAGLMIALVVVIDDAVVDMHNLVRRLRQHREQTGSEESVSWIIREAAVEMRSVVLYGALITLLAVAPIFFMEGLFGAFLQPLAFSYALAVVLSMLVAMTVTPALCLMLLRNAPSGHSRSPLAEAIRRGYDAVFARILDKPAVAFCGLGLIVLAAAAVIPQLRQETLLPTFKETDLVVELDGKAGTSQPEMSRIAAQASRDLRSIPGVKNVSGHVGRAVMSDEVADVNSSELWVSIDPTADYNATVASIKDVVHNYTGLDREVKTYLNERIGDELRAEEREIVVRVFGEEMKVLRRKALEVKDVLAKTNGVVDAIAELPVEKPTVEIEPVLAKCKDHGLKPGDVRRAAAILLSGIQVGSLFEEQKVFDVVVWGAPHIRNSLTDVRELLIEAPGGGHVNLGDVAEIRIVPAATNITREAVARYIDVTAQVKGRDLASIAVDVKRGLRQVQFPMEFRAELLGAPLERLAAQQRLQAFAIAAAVIIFLLLQAAFGSWRLASLVFLTLPLALVGGLVAVLAGGGLVSVGSAAGFVAVLAIAARNSVVLINRYQRLANPEHNDVDPDVAQFRAQFEKGSPLNGYTGEYPQGDISPELVRDGTRERLVPIVMTAAATAILFAPLAFFGGIPGHEIVSPMAVVILGGLVTSTLFSLYLLPALYLWLQAKPAPDIVTERVTADERVAQTQAAAQTVD